MNFLIGFKMGSLKLQMITDILNLVEQLNFLHINGQMHNDLKVDNIMRDIQTKIAMLTDFGITLPDRHSLGGTYVSPGHPILETMRNSNQATPRVGNEAEDLFKHEIYVLILALFQLWGVDIKPQRS